MDQRPRLSPGQEAELLAIARQAIGDRVRGKPLSPVVTLDVTLEAPGAAFVTLTRRGALRGCIGYVHPLFALGEAVAHCAASAATEDPRFPPMTEAELADVEIEISVLSALVRLEDPQTVEVGVHGLVVSSKGRRGLLLPQVASERRWDAETFLRQTCIKAGLPPNQWRDEAEIHVFTVHNFTDGLPVEPPPAD